MAGVIEDSMVAGFVTPHAGEGRMRGLLGSGASYPCRVKSLPRPLDHDFSGFVGVAPFSKALGEELGGKGCERLLDGHATVLDHGARVFFVQRGHENGEDHAATSKSCNCPLAARPLALASYSSNGMKLYDLRITHR